MEGSDHSVADLDMSDHDGRTDRLPSKKSRASEILLARAHYMSQPEVDGRSLNSSRSQNSSRQYGGATIRILCLSVNHSIVIINKQAMEELIEINHISEMRPYKTS